MSSSSLGTVSPARTSSLRPGNSGFPATDFCCRFGVLLRKSIGFPFSTRSLAQRDSNPVAFQYVHATESGHFGVSVHGAIGLLSPRRMPLLGRKWNLNNGDLRM